MKVNRTGMKKKLGYIEPREGKNDSVKYRKRKKQKNARTLFQAQLFHEYNIFEGRINEQGRRKRWRVTIKQDD